MRFDINFPIYIQIIDEIKRRIVTKEWENGRKISSVRDLAKEFEVNPNTMQRAFVELEREGLIYTERTSGRFITDDKELIERVKMDIVKEAVQKFEENMKQIGVDVSKQIQEIIDMAGGKINGIG